MIDGGHLRKACKQAGKPHYHADYINRVARHCLRSDEALFRIIYYDCAPYDRTVELPISRDHFKFEGNDRWLQDLAEIDFFAVRRGVLKFRGWSLRPGSAGSTRDEDFRPEFEQKGVDVMIGLDTARFTQNRLVDRLIFITGDTDFVPAFEFARTGGLQVVVMTLPEWRCPPELAQQSDFTRQMLGWP